jgi:hypothetical protein
MGFSRLGLAIGGAIGYVGGGWLFDMGKALAQPELPWMMLGIIGFITFLALGWQFSLKRPTRGCWNQTPDSRTCVRALFSFFCWRPGRWY